MRRSKRCALRVSWSDGPAGRSGAPTWRNGEAFQGVDASATSESGTSAGGVVIREGSDEGREVVLVGRGRRVRWALPKGTQRPGEPLEGTAVREVQEETGLLVRRLRPLGEIHYRFKLAGVRYDKTIHFYLMQATGGDTVDHDHEYDYVEWVPAEEALRRIAYPNEARLVERALALLPVQPGSTGLARRGG
jgi:8-oxo-dGTP pyrophosphatase MutT (NUDIX family)